MKFVILICGVMMVVCQQSDISYYVTEDDYSDVDALVADLAALQAYSNCFLDRGPCTSLAQSFKVIMQDSVINACDRCNVPQKQQYGRFIQALKTKLPQDYYCLRQKYDPKNIYYDALEAELSKFWNYTTRAQRPTTQV